MVSFNNRALTLRHGLPRLLFKSGAYYGPSLDNCFINSTGVSFAQDFDYIVPFLSRTTQTWDRIAIENTGAVSLNFRMAVYADSGSGYPGALLADSGTVTTSGAAADNAATISAISAYESLNWLILNCASAIAFKYLETAISSGYNEHLGAYGNLADFPLGTVLTDGFIMAAARAHAAFPATYAATISGMSRFAPVLRLRAA